MLMLMSGSICVSILERGKKIAHKSTLTHKHSAIIIHKGNIVAEGINYGGTYISRWYAVHAEIDALHKIKHRSKKFREECSIVCVRVVGNDTKMSKPCINCENIIKQYGIKRIFFTCGE
jgi:deoxycytidylate deaminase